MIELNRNGCTKFRKAIEADKNYEGIEASWFRLINGSELLTQLNMTITEHEWMRIVSHNSR